MVEELSIGAVCRPEHALAVLIGRRSRRGFLRLAVHRGRRSHIDAFARCRSPATDASLGPGRQHPRSDVVVHLRRWTSRRSGLDVVRARVLIGVQPPSGCQRCKEDVLFAARRIGQQRPITVAVAVEGRVRGLLDRDRLVNTRRRSGLEPWIRGFPRSLRRLFDIVRQAILRRTG